MIDEPLFELHGKDGHKWLLYEDGRVTGFPEGTLVVNRARGRLSALLCLTRALIGNSNALGRKHRPRVRAPHSEQTKLAMSLAAKARWARVKGVSV